MRVTFVFGRRSDREICLKLQVDLSPNALALPSDPARELARPGSIKGLTRAIPLLVKRPLRVADSTDRRNTLPITLGGGFVA